MPWRTGLELAGTVISGLATLTTAWTALAAFAAPFALRTTATAFAIAVTFATLGAFGVALRTPAACIVAGFGRPFEGVEYLHLNRLGWGFLGCGFAFNDGLGCICLRCGGSFGFSFHFRQRRLSRGSDLSRDILGGHLDLGLLDDLHLLALGLLSRVAEARH